MSNTFFQGAKNFVRASPPLPPWLRAWLDLDRILSELLFSTVFTSLLDKKYLDQSCFSIHHAWP